MGNIIGTTEFVHYHHEDHNLTCIRKFHSLMNENSPTEHVKEKNNTLKTKQTKIKPTTKNQQTQKISTKQKKSTTHTTKPRTGLVICQQSITFTLDDY